MRKPQKIKFILMALATTMPTLLASAFVPFANQRRRMKQPLYPPSVSAKISVQSFLSVQTVPLRAGDQITSSGDSRTVTEMLWSYVYNIHKARTNNGDASKPIKSLVFLLHSSPDIVEEDTALLQEALERSMVQSIRSASADGDYRLILSLIAAVIEFCHGNRALLSPRIFGEAIESISRTSANVNKLKQVWRMAIEHSHLLTTPLGAFELNTMIKALAGRQKLKAALELYRTSGIEGDAYTASTLLNLLKESIVDDQAISKHGADGKSPCWQFEEGMNVLKSCRTPNNFVFCAALHLNDRASSVFRSTGRRHFGSQAALDLLEYMKFLNVSPDIVTCSTIMSTFDKGYQWKAALSLLNIMEQPILKEQKWSLPRPNEYAYSSAISACARCNEYTTALELLSRMKNVTEPNTWVYNAALSACVSSSRQNRANRIQMALSLLEQMRRSHGEDGLDTAPDTVSYNTALAVMDEFGTILRDDQGRIVLEYFEKEREAEWSNEDDAATGLLHQMRRSRIPRDALTYHNAIKASISNSAAIFQMLEWAEKDLSYDQAATTRLTGRAADGMRFIFNAALSVFSLRGDLDLIARTFRMMKGVNVSANSETISDLIQALGTSRNSVHIITLFNALKETKAAIVSLKNACGVDVSMVIDGRFQIDETLYSTAITASLSANDLDSALAILVIMKESGMRPSQTTMQEIAFSYSHLAIEAAGDESNIQRKLRKMSGKKHLYDGRVERAAQSRAAKADAILQGLDSPPPQLLSAVCRAYSASGLLDEARRVLQAIHQRVLEEESSAKAVLGGTLKNTIDILPRLHRSLMKICASKGNVTAALFFVDDIQHISNALSVANGTLVDMREVNVSDRFDSVEDDHIFDIKQLVDMSRNYNQVGMKANDWMLLLISASKSGHWKICFNTLQFLRPYLEVLHPNNAKGDEDRLLRKYKKLARGLSAAVLGFEMRNQDAWALRAIEDWIQWSGRRPQKEAVTSAFRILATRGRGLELVGLLARVLQIRPSPGETQNSGPSYEEILYIGAITALHINGLYDDADDLYVDAMAKGFLPYCVSTGEESNQVMVDLHGMNVALAHSAVRIALQQDVLMSGSDASQDLLIVTGRGRHSAYQMKPVLRPEIQRMLTEEFYPPLNTASVPGNMGALIVPLTDIQAWVSHQRQMKGLRMLTVADMIKSLSGLKRIQRSISLSSVGKSSEGGETKNDKH
jgi:Smr domain/Pentatricopeptide repeat domain